MMEVVFITLVKSTIPMKQGYYITNDNTEEQGAQLQHALCKVVQEQYHCKC